jgi:hypothetical protein
LPRSPATSRRPSSKIAVELPILQGKADPRGRRHPLAPIPWFYRQIDMSKQNVGLQGRINSTREEQLDSQTGWWPAPLSGGSM